MVDIAEAEAEAAGFGTPRHRRRGARSEHLMAERGSRTNQVRSATATRRWAVQYPEQPTVEARQVPDPEFACSHPDASALAKL